MKTVFITGASSGLGRGLALHYAKAGAKVFAAARRREELEKLARESENIVPVPLDVQDTGALVNASWAAAAGLTWMPLSVLLAQPVADAVTDCEPAACSAGWNACTPLSLGWKV